MIKGKTIDGTEVIYSRWHFGIHARFIVTGVFSTRIKYENAWEWSDGLRGIPTTAYYQTVNSTVEFVSLEKGIKINFVENNIFILLPYNLALDIGEGIDAMLRDEWRITTERNKGF